MASNVDVGVDVRRNRRRVRVRKTPKTTTINVDDAVMPNDNADLPIAPEVEHARQDGSADQLVVPAVSVRCQQTPTTTINGSIDDSELTAVPRSEMADNRDLGVQPSTGADDATLDIRNHPSVDDRPSHPPHGAATKNPRGKRRVKNGSRAAAEVTKDTLTDQQLNGHEVSGDWFTAVRRADIATVRRLAQSRTIDVNSTDEHGNTALHIAAEIKNAELVAVLASVRDIDVNRRNSNGETALYVSARLVDTTTASCLLAAGADANAARSDDGSTPLHCACQDGDGSVLVVLLLEGGSRPDAGRRSARSGVTGITPLHDAADVGDSRSIATLLQRDETLADSVTDRGCTALHVAARHGYRDIVDQLLSHNAYVAQPGADSRGLGVQPLHLAAENGGVDAVRGLLAAGADPNATREFCGKTGVTALHLTAIRGHVEVATVLLETGAAVDAADEDGATALHVAARGGMVEVAWLLLKHGAVIDATTSQPRVRRHGGRNSDGLTVGRAFSQTPLHFAVRYRHLDVAAMLVKAGSDVNAAEQMLGDATALRHRSSQFQAENSVPSTSTFRNGPMVATSTTTSSDLVNGYTALHWAVENNDRDAVQLLLEAGADVNRVATFDAHLGVTPLHLAAQDGHTDVAGDLLRQGAMRDPRKSTRNRENITPLHQAVYNSHPATVAVLLAAGCDPNVQADNGYAALHYAAQKGSIEMTRAILDTSECDVALTASTREQQDITALHLAVQSGNVDVVLALVAAGAPIDAGKRMGGGVCGVTALHQAVYQERDEIVAALLELGADPLRSMDGWYTPLHVAAEKGCSAIARRLVEATSGGNEPAVDARASLDEHVDLTPLHVAAQHGHRQVIEVLIDAGADTWAVRGFGDRVAITVLHLSAENGFVDAVVAILEATATDGGTSPLIDAQDSLGFTALHLAVQYQFPNIVQVLVDAGADVCVRTNDGRTAWLIAKQQNDASILHILGPEPPTPVSMEAIPPLLADKRKPSKLRSLLCGMNKH